MALTHGLLATLTAKPGKEQDLADFLVQGQSLAEAEEGRAFQREYTMRQPLTTYYKAT